MWPAENINKLMWRVVSRCVLPVAPPLHYSYNIKVLHVLYGHNTHFIACTVCFSNANPAVVDRLETKHEDQHQSVNLILILTSQKSVS